MKNGDKDNSVAFIILFSIYIYIYIYMRVCLYVYIIYYPILLTEMWNYYS